MRTENHRKDDDCQCAHLICMDHDLVLATVVGPRRRDELETLAGILAKFGFQEAHADCGVRTAIVTTKIESKKGLEG